MASLFLTLDYLITSCANQGSPGGGPKDSIPPVLIHSYPTNGEVNFVEKQFEFEFSERINANKLAQQLIVTPKSDFKFKVLPKREKLVLKIIGEFKDSTTYNFNFGKGVVDITERNPVDNFFVAFSTGPFIDSLRILGKVVDLFKQKPVSKYTVGLYPATDTLDLLKETPVYFTTTSDSGDFQINYIKAGTYKLLTFNDKNNNVILDPLTEHYGFIAGNIVLDTTTVLKKPIQSLLLDVRPIKYINNRSIGPYIEAKYNKYIHSYEVEPGFLEHNLFGENKDGIRIYKSNRVNLNDSLEIILYVKDSLYNITVDTIKNIFQDNYRRPNSYQVNKFQESKIISDTNFFKLMFNKPTYQSDSLRFSIIKDSTYRQEIPYRIAWNKNKTEASVYTYLNKDSLLYSLRMTIPEDTNRTEDREAERLREINFRLQLEIAKNSFISIESDSSAKQEIDYQTKEFDLYGSLLFRINTTYNKFSTQLLNSKNQVAYEIENKKEPEFKKVKPDTYQIRILIDSNENGIWEFGNLLIDEEPEPIYMHPEPTSIRENWIEEIDITIE